MRLRTKILGSLPLASVMRRYAWTIPIIVALGLLGTALEGIGIGLVIPLLQILNDSQGSGAMGGVARLLTSFGAGLETDARLAVISATIFALILVKNIVAYGNRVFVAWVYGRASHEIRSTLAERLMRVGYPFFLEQTPGRLINVLANETWRASDAIQAAFGMVSNLAAATIFLTFLFLLSWKMTLLLALGLIAVQGVQALMSWRLKHLSDRVVAHNNVLASRMLDAVHAPRLVRVFGREEHEHARFDDASDSVRQAIFVRDTRLWRIQPTVEVLHAALFLAILVGAWRAGVDFPLLAAFIVLLYRLQPPVRAIQSAMAQLRSWSGSIQEVDWLLDTSDKPPEPYGRLPFERLSASIVFDAVSFRYGRDASASPALEDVSFVIRKGRSTAIVGHSGAGKTTIISLLCRLVEPTSGVILVDGMPLAAIDPKHWRRRLALASQDLELVDGTIFDNIVYGAAKATREEAQEAARLVDAHDFIRGLPQGYDTLVGYRGVNFSAGQRQRIALARALVRDPDILILDEATNAVDGLSEASIIEALKRRAVDRTTILISHRQSAVAFCDDGIVIRNGSVSAYGPLGELGVLDRADLCA